MIETLEPRMLLTSVFTVTNTEDSGFGSLRQAITDANAVALPSNTKIVFDIDGTGVQTIKLGTDPLPAITVRVDIQGTTDSSGNPLIEIDGSGLGDDSNGLVFARNTLGNTKPSYVSGLIINNCPGNGITIIGAGLTDIFGCRIGTDASGKHSRQNHGDGIFINSSDNQIGWPLPGPAYQNLISGNQFDGIGIGTSGSNNTIQNNLVGSDAQGKHALPNGGNGLLAKSSGQLIGGDLANEGNLFSGNSVSGIELDAGNTDILGNKFGVNLAGTAVLAGTLQFNAINLSGTTGVQIGNQTAGGRNIIGGNNEGAIFMVNTTNTEIDNNYIGTDVTGNKAIANGLSGIQVSHGTNDRFLGNVIDAAFVDGVLIGGASTGINVFGNRIGIGSNGASLPNQQNGIEILDATGSDLEGNNITNNLWNGIEVEGDTSTGNFIESNDIFANGHLGIKLGADTNKPLPNHTGAATGPNHDQNYPVITSAVATFMKTTITGTVSGPANTSIRMLFYRNDSADPTGFGEGSVFSGTIDVMTDGSGNASFSDDVSNSFAGQIWTATASVSSGPNSGDTSEFSKGVKVSGAAITGTVFNDANGNGKQDPGEEGLKGRTVYVDQNKDNSPFNNDFNSFGITDAKGKYRIFSIDTGVNRVRLLPTTGWKQTFPKSNGFQDVTVTALNTKTGVNFGEEKTAGSSAVAKGSFVAPALASRKLKDIVDALGLRDDSKLP